MNVFLGVVYFLAGMLLHAVMSMVLSSDGTIDGFTRNAVIMAVQLCLMAFGAATVLGRKTNAPIVTLFLTSLLFSGLIVEVGIRIYTFGIDGLSPSQMKSFHRLGQSGLVQGASSPRIVYELIPNLDARFRLVRFQTNQHGLRDVEYAVEKPPNTRRIAVVGDSFTMGSGVEAERLYHSVMERRHNASGSGIRYEFINFGVGGYTLRHYPGVVEEKALEYSPDLILVGFCPDNDFVVPKPAEFEFPYVAKRIKRNSFFVPYTVGFLRLAVRQWTHPPEHHPPTPRQRAYLKEFVGQLASLSQEFDVPIAVAYLAHISDYPDSGPLRKIVEENGMIFIDAGVELKNRGIREVSTMPPLDVHPNSLAHEAFAETISKALVGRGLLLEN